MNNQEPQESAESHCGYIDKSASIIIIAVKSFFSLLFLKPMNPQVQLNPCIILFSWILLQIVSKWKSFIKRPIKQELPYIKLLYKNVCTVLHWCLKYNVKQLIKSLSKTMTIDLLEWSLRVHVEIEISFSIYNGSKK